MIFERLWEALHKDLTLAGQTTYTERDVIAYSHDTNQENIQTAIDHLQTLPEDHIITAKDMIEILKKVKG